MGSASILELKGTYTQTSFAASCETANYEYTKEVVRALLDGYYEGVGDTEQRMDLVAGLKKLPKNAASILLAEAWGWKPSEAAKRLGLHRGTVWEWRKKALSLLVDRMNGR